MIFVRNAAAMDAAEPPVTYVAWLDLGDGGWIRAFETDDPVEAAPRLALEQYKAGARQARLLPAGLTPAEEPEPGDYPPCPLAAASVWKAGKDGRPPTIDVSRAVGWLFADSVWERVCEDEDFLRCAQRTRALALGRETLLWQVLPEGRVPKENER